MGIPFRSYPFFTPHSVVLNQPFLGTDPLKVEYTHRIKVWVKLPWVGILNWIFFLKGKIISLKFPKQFLCYPNDFRNCFWTDPLLVCPTCTKALQSAYLYPLKPLNVFSFVSPDTGATKGSPWHTLFIHVSTAHVPAHPIDPIGLLRGWLHLLSRRGKQRLVHSTHAWVESWVCWGGEFQPYLSWSQPPPHRTKICVGGGLNQQLRP